MACMKDKALKYTMMANVTKVNGMKGTTMAKEISYLLMETFIKYN